MTKNLHQPSDQTQLANQGYRIRQLERRPAPVGGAGAGASCLPYALISADFSPDGVEVADSTPTTFASLPTFTDSYVSDPSMFTVDLDTAEIVYITEGVYLAEATLQWDESFAGTKIVNIHWDATSFDVQSIWTEELEVDSEHTHVQSLVIPQGEGNSLTASFEQQSGSPRFLLRCTLKIIRLAVYPDGAECEGGSSPTSWMTLDADTAVASGGANTTILDGAENSFDSDPDVLFADTANGYFDILEPGYYVAKFRGCWGSTATDYFAIITWEADVPGSSPCGSSFDLQELATGTSWGVTGSDLVVAIGATSRVRGSIHHLTGAPRTVTFASMSVTRVSTYDETPSS